MKSPLVHGCYDLVTLNTLLKMGVDRIGFDLRARSPNLIPLHELKSLLAQKLLNEIVLTFQRDKHSTVHSFIDLLKNDGVNILLEFRDQESVNFYHSIDRPFLWMFHPEGDWRSILSLPKLQGVLLPLRWKKEYQTLPTLWDMIDHRQLNVYLHADSIEEAGTIEDLDQVNLSLDLTSEVEKSFRCVDQERLQRMQLWGKLNENSTI